MNYITANNEMVKIQGLYSCDIPEGIFNTIKKIKRVFIILEDRGIIDSRQLLQQ